MGGQMWNHIFSNRSLKVGVLIGAAAVSIGLLSEKGLIAVHPAAGFFLLGPAVWFGQLTSSKVIAYASLFAYYCVIASVIAKLPLRLRVGVVSILAVIHFVSAVLALRSHELYFEIPKGAFK